MTEYAEPTITDRVQAFLHPPQRPLVHDPDELPRTIRSGDFDEAVLILEALVEALKARLGDTRAKDATEEMAETITKLINDLTEAAGDVNQNSRAWSASEWETDLRWVLAMGTDSRYKDV